MSNRDAFGPDTLLAAVYLSTGPDDPGLDAWKREHPDGFEAGTWTRPAGPADPTAARRRRVEATRTVGIGRVRTPLDPATISVADFQDVAAQAAADAGSLSATVPSRPSPAADQGPVAPGQARSGSARPRWARVNNSAKSG